MNTSKTSVLVVDDESIIRELFLFNLTNRNYSVDIAASHSAAIKLFKAKRHDIVITDLNLPESSGKEILQDIQKIEEETIMMIITGYASVESSLELLKIGAEDYFPKPVNFDHIDLVIQRALARRRLHLDHEKLKKSIGLSDSCCDLIGASKSINDIYKLIEGLAGNDLTVLIQGETGTGKELAARAIHQLSNRHQHPFIAVNCGSLPESLLESELFGYIKGSFTGATANKAGLFDAANHGTILLDEIEAAPLHTQIALLRVLDRKEILPVGARQAIPLNVRIIVTSNEDLETKVAQKTFREDLFYRIIESIITIPPLRERLEDIPLLTQFFLTMAPHKENQEPRRFSPRSMAMLSKHNWPGNVRELKHLIFRAATTAPRPIIRPIDLPPEFDSYDSNVQKFKSLSETEKEHLQAALQIASNNKAEAGRMLGVSRGTIYSLMRKHELG